LVFDLKLFKTSNINHAKYCQERFSFALPSDLWQKRVTKFDSKFTDFYVKVSLSFFSFFVCLFCCILCLLYFMLLYHALAVLYKDMTLGNPAVKKKLFKSA